MRANQSSASAVSPLPASSSVYCAIISAAERSCGMSVARVSTTRLIPLCGDGCGSTLIFRPTGQAPVPEIAHVSSAANKILPDAEM